MEWQPSKTAPKGEEILVCTAYGWIYVAEKRYGTLIEPQTSVLGWRDIHGKFGSPHWWMPLPLQPKKAQGEIWRKCFKKLD